MKSSFKKYLPNVLTIGRLFAVLPVFLLLGDLANPHYVELSIFCFFIVTSDLLDGWLARKWKADSILGRVLDAFVDKVVTIIMGYALYKWRGFPLWVYVGLLAMYGVNVIAGAYWLGQGRPIPKSRRLGKASVFSWGITGWFYILPWSVLTEPATYLSLLLTGAGILDYICAYGAGTVADLKNRLTNLHKGKGGKN